MFTRCRLLLTLLLLLTTTAAHAHLAVLRQGIESGEVPNTDDKFGYVVATGDFDNDGYDDLASAATWEANGLINSAAHGIVSVNFGTPFGLHQGNTLLSPGAPADNSIKFGSAMVSGDFNGDGFDDLAVGGHDADGPSPGNVVDSGGVWIYDGFGGGIQLAPSIYIQQSDVGALEEADDNFGWSLAAGDIDGDGTDDLVIGAIGENNSLGAVTVVYGSSPGGLQPSSALIHTPWSLGYTGGSEGGWFGYSVACDDLDGDGFADVAIGAPRTDVNGIVNSGRVYFLYGSAAGLSLADQWVFDHSTTLLGIDESAELGWSLAIGNFIERPDIAIKSIAIGAPGYAHNGHNDAGGVVWLSQDDLTRSAGNSASLMTQDPSLSYDDVHANDRFGTTLATGRFDADGWDDLAIGVVGDDIEEQPGLGQQSNAGSVYLRLGGVNTWSDKQHILHTTLNDHVFGGDNLGRGLAFGDFDGNGREALAIGAPYADRVSYDGGSTVFNAGRVYVHAPWRQVRDRPHRGSAALDCNGNLVYSQRAWQRMRPASTTKTMTLQLAADAINNGQNPNQLITVPAWVADSVGGSQVPLIAGEKQSFIDLMRTMMTVSGNDAAVLLGTVISGQGNSWQGWEATNPLFAQMMETKANQLGMSSATSFTNAAGIDAGDHYTTPLDFAKMAFETIQDDLVRETVNTSPWPVTRWLPGWMFGNFINTNLPVNQLFFNGFVDGVKSRHAAAVGNKGGQTPGALRTGTYNSNPAGPGGFTAASGFGVWDDDDPIEGAQADCNSCVGAGLLKVADTFCQQQNFPDDIVLPDPPSTPWGTLTNWEPNEGDPIRALGLTIDQQESDDPGRVVQIDVLRRNQANPTANFRAAITRTSENCLAAGQVVDFGIAPYEQHFGFRIVNVGTDDAQLALTATDPLGYSQTLTLVPGAEFTVAPASGNPAPSFTLNIANTAPRGDACLEVEELGYLSSHVLGDGIGLPDVASMLLMRWPSARNETIDAFFEGKDVLPGNLLDISLHRNGTSTAIDPGDFTPGAVLPTGAHLLPNLPNPFNPSTQVRFDLREAGPVDLLIYDVQGRRVRTLLRGEWTESGRQSVKWNGSDDGGLSVASGVYYVKLRASGVTDTHRMVLLK